MRLIVFDVDGTLVDSQRDIVTAMGAAYDAVGLAPPNRADVLSIVGLSLEVAVARLEPDADHLRMITAYKEAYAARRAETGAAISSPLYPGARELLRELAAEPQSLLGIATGKSKRGLDHLLAAHGLERIFVTRQVADFHPSKPHPSMLQTAMDETGCAPDQVCMIGDTSYDMEMARAARVTPIGVSWGYHRVEALAPAAHIANDFVHLSELLQQWRPQET